jgi:hypothetical protein
MKRGFVTLFVVFQSFGVILGQGKSTSTNHYFGYSIGIAQAKEENLLPKVHSGVIHTIAYLLESKGTSYQSLEFQLGYGTLATAIANDAGSMNAQLLLGCSYDLKIRENGSSTCYLGPRIAFTSSLSEFETWDEAHAYWGNCISLGAGSVLFVALQSEKSLVMRADLSLLGISTRPDQHRLYANEHWTFSNIVTIMNRNYRFGAWNSAFQFRASAEYRTSFVGSSSLAFSFSLYYSRLKADEGNPLKEIISRIGIGVGL